LDVSGINKILTQKRDSLVQEVEALGSDKTAAINLAQRLAVEYSSSTTISDALKNYQIKLMSELVEQKARRRRNITLASLLLCGSIAGGVWVFNEQRASIARIQRERAIEAERTSKAVAAGRILLDDEGRSLLLIPIGSFEMGSNQEAHEKPLRTVNVGAFFMGETEVTYQEWKTVLAWAKSKGYEFKNEGKGSGEKHPVTNVNWYDVVKWCNAKSEKEGLAPCYKVGGTIYRRGEEDSVSCDWRLNGYRLPTEAEWEKAARGGLTGNRYPNSDSLVVGSANFSWNGTREVGLYARNKYGLRDMAGNVWEWCWDWYKSGYETGTSKDPIGPHAGSVRVLRGGGWNSSANLCRVSYRNTSNPTDCYGSYGLRLVRNLDLSAREKRVEQP
jgi:formylglycine-generating enzyme required for sulfatase activity